MAIAYVGSASGADTADPGTVVFSPNPTAGSLLVGAVRDSAGAAACAMADNKSQSWDLAGYSYHSTVRYVMNAGAGATTVTMTGGAIALRKHVAEFSGLATTNALDQVDVVASGTSTAATSDAITPVQADEVLISLVSTSSDVASFAIADGWTKVQETLRSALAYRIVSSIAAYSAAWTLGTSMEWYVMICSFKAASGAADRGMPRGMSRGMNRGVANAAHYTKQNHLWLPRERRIVIPVGINLQGV
jgi:hypothetical protein